MARASSKQPDQRLVIESYVTEVDGIDYLARRGDVLAADDPGVRHPYVVSRDSTTAEIASHRKAHGLRSLG